MSKYAGFDSVLLTRPQRSQFDLSHQKRLSTRMGRLTPVLIHECVPSDTFHGSSEILLRLAPLLAPIYDSIELFVHFFFVPNRLLWEEWEEFITGGRLGAEIDPATAPIPPYLNIGLTMTFNDSSFAKSSLADYLGVPIFGDITTVSGAYNISSLDIMPFVAYQLIWMEYYRDRNFIADDFYEFPVASGAHAPAAAFPWLQIRTRCYQHDYFTSALPFTQRGAEVLMPLAGTGSVNYLNQSQLVRTDGGPILNFSFTGTGDAAMGGGFRVNKANAADTGQPGRLENIASVDFDASSVSINDFRSAYALQVWLERNALGGSRYTENTQVMFGVRPQDSRLQRPEYIGGGRIPVKISEVVSTAYSDDGSGTVPLANMAGHGITYGNTNRFNYFCTEHGFIIGLMSIMSPPSYHQGLPRMFRRTTFLDYPWPTFAKLGEQEVHTYELYAHPANMDTNAGYTLFGYQSRYADWKYQCSTSHGDFHGSMMFWTLVRHFATSPVLGQAFNQFDDSTQDRIFAVSGGDNFWCYINNRVTVRRPLPYFNVPNTLGFS